MIDRRQVARRGRAMFSSAVLAAASCLLASCGGGGGSSGTPAFGSDPAPVDNGGSSGGSGTVSLQPASTFAQRCAAPRPAGTLDPFTGQAYGDQQGSVADEKSWLRSWTDETYLWYQDVTALGSSVLDPNGYATAVAYFAALKSPLITASGKPKDAFHFTYDTPAWVALSQSGVAYGYGFAVDLVSATVPRTAVVVSVDPNTEATTARLSRGALILSVDGVDLVNDASDAGVDVLNAGLFPEAGGTHTFTVSDPGSTVIRTITMTATPVTEIPVRNVQTLPAPNQSVGYLQFDDHIATSEVALIAAITQLKASAITDLVLDLRYNGGGYLDIAAELAYMIAGPATQGKTFDQIIDNGKNPFQQTAAQKITPFHDTSQGFSVASGQALPALGLTRLYVLVGGGTCSASEAIINGLRGVGVEVNLIGATTCGKPYGFYPQDNCNTTYFSIQFRGANALGASDYADGFTPTCAANDDYAHALGDPAEGMLAAALSYRGSGSCPAVVASAGRAHAQQASSARQALQALQTPLMRPPWRSNRIYRPTQTGQ